MQVIIEHGTAVLIEAQVAFESKIRLHQDLITVHVGVKDLWQGPFRFVTYFEFDHCKCMLEPESYWVIYDCRWGGWNRFRFCRGWNRHIDHICLEHSWCREWAILVDRFESELVVP